MAFLLLFQLAQLLEIFMEHGSRADMSSLAFYGFFNTQLTLQRSSCFLVVTLFYV